MSWQEESFVLLDADEVAARLGRSKYTVRRYVTEGKLVCVEHAGRHWFAPEEVDRVALLLGAATPSPDAETQMAD